MNKSTVNKFGLTERDMNTIQYILKKYPDVEEVFIFGSRALGNYKPGSDVDLSVMNAGVTLKTILRLVSDFEESSLPYNIDLVNLPDIKHDELIHHIKNFGISFYKKEAANV